MKLALTDSRSLTQLLGQLNNIQNTINNMYEYLRYSAISASQFDILALTAKQFDDKNICAKDFDLYGLNILLPNKENFMFNPFNRKL